MEHSILQGFLYRKTNLPNSILHLQKCLNGFKLKDCNIKDGRISSAIQEDIVIKILCDNFKDRIRVPGVRMWYDFLIYDYILGWLPVNIKITTTKTNDNVCNIAGLVHSYTNTELDYNSHYKNGKMSKILIECIKNGKLNTKNKDYYFLVINKTNNEVIVNSLRGLSHIFPNINNLPFQVKWDLNKNFRYKSILSTIKMFTDLFIDLKIDWKTEFIKEIKQLGQYFTKDKTLQNNVKKLVKNETGDILEPCIGRGDLVSIFPSRTFDMYEIDTSIDFLENIDKSKIVFGDFLQQEITKKYHTIVSNPPYVKCKDGNLYIKFIEKCFELLHSGGEMIFIIASDFFKKTHCSNIIKRMVNNGSFTDIFHPESEKLFDYANVNVLIFRYIKDVKINKCNYNNELLYVNECHGIITFDKSIKSISISENFEVKVGMVSGNENVFKQPFGNVAFIRSENVLEKYIFITDLPTENRIINEHLIKHKTELLNRKIRKFNESNWFEFGALRNYKFIKDNFGKKCIYVYTVTRNKIVAFIGNVGYFSANLLCMFPKNTQNLHKMVDYINSADFKKNYTYSGKFVIGQKQLEFHLFE